MVFRDGGPGGTKLGAHGEVVWWEGRLDALLTDSARNWQLRPASDIAAAEHVAAMALGCLAGEPMQFGGGSPQGEVRWFDLAHEFVFEDGRDGLAFLRTLAGMCPPRRKLDVWKTLTASPKPSTAGPSGPGVWTFASTTRASSRGLTPSWSTPLALQS